MAITNTNPTEFFRESFDLLAYTLIAIGFWYIAGTGLNDYADYEIDKINLKNDAQRPLIRGYTSKNMLLVYAISATLLSLITILLTGNVYLVTLLGALLILNVIYSIKPIQLSRRGGLAPALLPLGYIVLTVCSGLLLTSTYFDIYVILFISGMYLHFMARILLKDHRDIKGDMQHGKKTLVIKHGNAWVVNVSIIFLALSSVILVFASWDYIKNTYLYLILIVGAATTSLIYLANEERWKYQKPLITIFGRLCSAFITILAISFFWFAWAKNTGELTILSIIITGLFLWSIQSILSHQHPQFLKRKIRNP